MGQKLKYKNSLGVTLPTNVIMDKKNVSARITAFLVLTAKGTPSLYGRNRMYCNEFGARKATSEKIIRAKSNVPAINMRTTTDLEVKKTFFSLDL